MRKSKKPSVEAQSNIINIDQTDFGRMMYDIPASEIGDNVHRLVNAHDYGKYIEGRTGSKEATYLPTTLPKYPSYTSFRAYQSGHTVYRQSGAAFTNALLGQWMCWPTDPVVRNEIIGVVGADSLLVAKLDTQAEQSGTYIQGKTHVLYQHKMNKRFFLHIDSRLFYASFGDSTWTQIFQMGYYGLADSKSYVYEFDDYLVIVNENGIFKIKINADVPYFFKMNSPPPRVLIGDVAETELLTYGRPYIYSSSKLTGNDKWRYTKSLTRDRDRTDTEADDGATLIEQETGTTRLNNNKKDFGSVFTELPIGSGLETYGVLTCGNWVAGTDDQVLLWRAIDDGSFSITIDGSNYNVMVDYTNAENIGDIPQMTQDAIRGLSDLLGGVVVEIDPNAGNPRFIFRTAEVDGSTIGVLAAHTTGAGTDVSTGAGANFQGTAADGAAADNAALWRESNDIGLLTVSPIQDTPVAGGEYHLTHYTVYGPKDIGPDGTQLGNNPDAYTFLADVPHAKAYTGSVNAAGVLTLTQGMLSYADVGSILEFQDGTRVTIATVTGVATGTVLPVAAVAAQSCAIGNNGAGANFGVMTVTQAAFTLTIASGYALTDQDIGKPVFYSDGTINWIRSRTSATVAVMLNSATKASQAACINPTSRRFNDTITDETIEARFHFAPFTPDNRFYIELPNTDLGVVVPGFIVVAQTGDNVIRYTPLAKEARDQKYFAGSYNNARHFDDYAEGAIQRLAKYPDKLIVFCSRSVWGCPTNIPMVTEIKDFGITIAVLPNLTLLDNVGVLHVESADWVDVGKEIMITSEPAIRTFDGNSFSNENHADKQVMKILRRISTLAAGYYNAVPEGGYVISGAEVQ